MKKLCYEKGLFRAALTVSIIFLTVVFLYLAGVWYFRDKFIVNTWMNGIYCTGKTVNESNSEFQSTEAPSIRIVDHKKRSTFVSLKEWGYQENYTEALRSVMNTQNVWLWFLGADQVIKEIKPTISFDESRLTEFLKQMECVTEQREGKQVSILLTENGYALRDQTRYQVNIVALEAYLLQQLREGIKEITIDLEADGFYQKQRYTAEERKVLLQWDLVEKYQETIITYDMGTERTTLSKKELADMLLWEESGFAVDQQGCLMINREKTDAFVEALALKYDTYQKERSFQTTRGDAVTISKGTYGTRLDQEAEKEYLYQVLSEGLSEVHIPAYLNMPYQRGLDDIGDTYIEIDLTNQKMYFYQSGECLVETDVVTGNVSKRWGTPEGIYAVFAKERNRILSGRDYASFVKYWMPYYRGIGIHDASWRNTFGGTIYQKNGSHGCINTPEKWVKIIYEEVEVGTPVIVYY